MADSFEINSVTVNLENATMGEAIDCLKLNYNVLCLIKEKKNTKASLRYVFEERMFGMDADLFTVIILKLVWCFYKMVTAEINPENNVNSSMSLFELASF